jgi:hypothetical protein
MKPSGSMNKYGTENWEGRSRNPMGKIMPPKTQKRRQPLISLEHKYDMFE